MDIDGNIAALKPYAGKIFIVTPDSPRAMDAEKIYAVCAKRTLSHVLRLSFQKLSGVKFIIAITCVPLSKLLFPIIIYIYSFIFTRQNKYALKNSERQALSIYFFASFRIVNVPQTATVPRAFSIAAETLFHTNDGRCPAVQCGNGNRSGATA